MFKPCQSSLSNSVQHGVILLQLSYIMSFPVLFVLELRNVLANLFSFTKLFFLIYFFAATHTVTDLVEDLEKVDRQYKIRLYS